MHSASLKVFGALAATLVVASPALAQRMERGAFLRRPANSRAQLLAEVREDPIVAARYARHFGMTQSQLEQYFGTLRLTTVPSTRSYLVWHVNPNGTIGSKNLLLKKGTGVFVDRHGRIVLKKSCGNPMVSGEVARRDITQPAPPKIPTTEVAMVPAPPEVIPTQPDVVPTVVPPPVVTEVTPPPIVETTPAPIAPPVTAVAAPPIIPIHSGGGSNWLPLVGIPILGGVILGGGHGGGHHGPPPVPEPTSVVTLAAGVGLVLARRKKGKG